ncbi:methyltransferase domain-containing protein [Gracilibacillus salitolerans]|uniref:Methyltransferase domain-containing protein n=1 Tax=Gracilibacillus salitolerans TaxID=2663022 RepID=A0A5Q2TKQ8_9BACI|nr:class I SAM-dependent methyltransferase [Gracilibacillus salitolerans]QGH35225.1 methyltransferase domain-containing protein [Gracilibacillus salitolerans]
MKKSLKEIHEYWKNNSYPEKYRVATERSIFLLSYIEKYIQTNQRILEIGCNVGRNLHHLFENNYKELTGIEISQEAVEQLHKNYPDLAEHTDIIHASAESVLKHMEQDHYDLVFTMAVLEHIHPDSEWLFDHIARITKSYLITFEAENYEHWRIFPRDYRGIFEDLGFEQVEEATGESARLPNYTLRIFKKTNLK